MRGTEGRCACTARDALRVARLVGFASALSGCAAPFGAPEEPPEWKVGPGCTIYTPHRLNDTMSDITAEHFDVCPLVVPDSVRVR
jgi:hypothetical protein